MGWHAINYLRSFAGRHMTSTRLPAVTINAALLALASVTIFFTPTALACSCGRAMGDEAQFSAARDVFVGRVVETRWIPDSGSKTDWQCDGHVEAKVQVLERVKGSQADVVTVTSGVVDSSNCAYPLMAGVQYVFFLSSKTEVSQCGGARYFLFTVDDRQTRIDELRKLSTRGERK